MLPCLHHAFQRTDCPLPPFLSVFSPALGLACLLRFEKISFPRGCGVDSWMRGRLVDVDSTRGLDSWIRLVDETRAWDSWMRSICNWLYHIKRSYQKITSVNCRIFPISSSHSTPRQHISRMRLQIPSFEKDKCFFPLLSVCTVPRIRNDSMQDLKFRRSKHLWHPNLTQKTAPPTAVGGCGDVPHLFLWKVTFCLTYFALLLDAVLQECTVAFFGPRLLKGEQLEFVRAWRNVFHLLQLLPFVIHGHVRLLLYGLKFRFVSLLNDSSGLAVNRHANVQQNRSVSYLHHSSTKTNLTVSSYLVHFANWMKCAQKCQKTAGC